MPSSTLRNILLTRIWIEIMIIYVLIDKNYHQELFIMYLQFRIPSWEIFVSQTFLGQI